MKTDKRHLQHGDSRCMWEGQFQTSNYVPQRAPSWNWPTISTLFLHISRCLVPVLTCQLELHLSHLPTPAELAPLSLSEHDVRRATGARQHLITYAKGVHGSAIRSIYYHLQCLSGQVSCPCSKNPSLSLYPRTTAQQA